MIRAGIIGGAGYTAGELLRILLYHPEVTLAFVQSESHAGEGLWTAHQDLYGETELKFTADAPVEEADVIFLCGGHGKSRGFVAGLPASYGGKIVDLSQDFRLRADCDGFVYGLPEAFRSEIKGARKIANPGCFATCIQLALLPLAKAGKTGEVSVTGITGSTGAGQKPSETTHFSWRSGNMSVYKPFTHQHLHEIRETLHRLDSSWTGGLSFVPFRGCFPRGIIVSAFQDSDLSEEEARELYHEYYKDEPFVEDVDFNPDMKMALGTNRGFVHVEKIEDKLLVVSVLDNLVKGASGQAVQNMNLAFGLEESLGLRLKSIRF
jgi:N-acetyl-gamma-glutamyl-phosphate reductase